MIKERYDRIIVITDEQAHDSVPKPKGHGYVINVASYKMESATGPGFTSTAGVRPSLITSARSRK